MRIRMKKTVLIILVFGLILFVVNLMIMFFIGVVDYSQTFQTSYERTDTHEQIIRTSWAELQTKSSFYHIANRPTCPGFVGLFITRKGRLDYEYGMFAPSFESHIDRSKNYEIKEYYVNQYLIQTAENNEEFGIYIPLQNDMKWPLIIWPSTTAKELRQEIINITTTANYNIH